MNFRKCITVLVLFGLLLPSIQSFGQAEQQAQPSAPQTTQTDKSKEPDKKQSTKTTAAKNDKEASKPHYYTNSAGQRVQSPTNASAAPKGATAMCRDGSYSFSQSRRGTCSPMAVLRSGLLNDDRLPQPTRKGRFSAPTDQVHALVAR